MNFQKKESMANKLFFNFSLTKGKKVKSNNISASNEKSKDENSYELLKQNDYNNLKKKFEMLKIEIDMVNKMQKDNKINIDKLMKDLDELNSIKNKKQKILENNLSQKETLEEICNTLIANIKNNNYINSKEDYFIEISLEEIKIKLHLLIKFSKFLII